MTLQPAKEQEEDLRRQRDRFVVFAFAAAEVILEVSSKGRIDYAAGATREFLGAEADKLIGASLLDFVDGDDKALVEVILSDLTSGYRFGPLTVRLVGSDGEGISTQFSGCRLPEVSDEIYLSIRAADVGIGGDANRSKAPSDELHDQATLSAMAGDAISAACESGRHDLRLTMLRVRGLEDLGARVGEQRLDALQSRIGSLLRAQSLYGTGAGRLEDGKFAVLHDARVDGEKVGRSVEKLASQMDQGGPGLVVESSEVGLDPVGLSPEDAAKAVVYTINSFANSKADNFTISSLTEGYQALLSDTVTRLTAAKAAIAEEQIGFAFQPIVELATRETKHFELLARLADGTSPFQFISFAEQVGLIIEFDLYACRRAIEHLDNYPVLRRRPLAVNLSSYSLQSEAFAGALLELIHNFPGGRDRLMFEVTESSEIKDFARVDSVIQLLRRAGIKVGLDDFGTGTNSFKTLYNLTVDFLKIDGSYIGRVVESARDWAMLKAMVGLSRDFGIPTVGEMIETEEQAEKVLTLGVDLGQGYLFGRPESEPLVCESTPPTRLRQVRRQNEREMWS